MARKKRISTATPLFLSIADVAIQLGVCRQTVYNYIYREGLPSLLVGRIRRIDPVSLGNWLKQREQTFV
jgi:excisionase family DNA binding protein